jgi:hypothetical protein
MEEELWTPIATLLKLQAAEVETIRRARQTKSAWCAMTLSDFRLPACLLAYLLTCLLAYFLFLFTRCAMILSDPTSLAQTHPALHALLAQLAAASLEAAAAVSSE